MVGAFVTHAVVFVGGMLVAALVFVAAFRDIYDALKREAGEESVRGKRAGRL